MLKRMFAWAEREPLQAMRFLAIESLFLNVVLIGVLIFTIRALSCQPHAAQERLATFETQQTKLVRANQEAAIRAACAQVTSMRPAVCEGYR